MESAAAPRFHLGVDRLSSEAQASTQDDPCRPRRRDCPGTLGQIVVIPMPEVTPVPHSEPGSGPSWERCGTRRVFQSDAGDPASFTLSILVSASRAGSIACQLSTVIVTASLWLLRPAES